MIVHSGEMALIDGKGLLIVNEEMFLACWSCGVMSAFWSIVRRVHIADGVIVFSPYCTRCLPGQYADQASAIVEQVAIALDASHTFEAVSG